MAIVTAQALLYNGTILNVIDKQTSAVMVNQSLLSCVPQIVFSFPSLNMRARSTVDSQGDFENYGGVADLEAVAKLRCRFPTYIRIDWDKIYVPEGRDVTIKLEEGFVVEGLFEGSTRQRLPANPNLITFRTPKRITQNITSNFDLTNTINRIRPGSADLFSNAGLAAIGIYNPGSFAALLAGLFKLDSVVGNIKPLAADLNAVAEVAAIVGNIKQFNVDLDASFTIENAVTGFARSLDADLTATTVLSADAMLKPFVEMIALTTLNSTVGKLKTAQSSLESTFNLDIEIIPEFNRYERVTNPNPFGTEEADLFGHSVVVTRNADSFSPLVGFYAASAPGEDRNNLSNTGEISVFSPTNKPSTSRKSILGTSVDQLQGWLMSADYESNGDYYLVHRSRNQRSLTRRKITDIFFGEFGSGTITLLPVIGNPDPGASPSEFALHFKLKGNRVIASGDNNKSYLFDVTDQQSPAVPLNTFGHTGRVSISGDYAVIANVDSQEVYVYQISTNQLIHTISNPDQTTVDNIFGFSIDVDSDLIAVGAPGNNSEFFPGNVNRADGYTGKVYVFSAVTGQLVHEIIPQGNAKYFGRRVVMSKGQLLISDPGAQFGVRVSRGRVLLYNAISGLLVKEINPLPNVSGGFTAAWGESIDIKDDILIVGSPRGSTTFQSDTFDSGVIEVWISN